MTQNKQTARQRLGDAQSMICFRQQNQTRVRFDPIVRRMNLDRALQLGSNKHPCRPPIAICPSSLGLGANTS